MHQAMPNCQAMFHVWVCLYVAWLAACAVLVHSTLIRAIQANNKTVKNVFMASAEKPIPGLRNPPRNALSLG